MQQDPVAEIKSKLSIIDVVSEKVALKKAGRIWKGLCPWHQENTPSFTVSPDKEMCYCFGCHRGGDIFSFVQLTENMDFKEALQHLADKAGVKLRHESPEQISRRQKLALANDLARQWFIFQLEKTAGGQTAREYLARRGVSAEAVSHFGLGWAPESWSGLAEHLTAQDLPNDLLLLAGLIKTKDGTDKFYDLFRARLMFPIKNASGKTIAFSGRVLDDSLPKYVNSPETPLFKKQHELFHFSDAKKSIAEHDAAVIVEGQLDVVASWEAGVDNVVAALGTALTQAHLEKILKLTNNLILAFDADSAGQKAARRSVEIALQLGAQIKMIKIPSGSDPDDIVRSEGAERWQEMVKNAVSWSDYFWKKLRQKYDPKVPADKRRLASELLALIKITQSPVEQEALLDELAARLGSSREALAREMNQLRQVPDAVVSGHPNLPRNQKTATDYLFGLFFAFPDLRNEAAPELAKIQFADELHKKIAQLIAKCYNGGVAGDFDSQLAEQERDLVDYAAQNSFFIAEKFAQTTTELRQQELRQLLRRVRRTVGSQLTRTELLTELQEARQSGDTNRETELQEQLSQLLHLLK